MRVEAGLPFVAQGLSRRILDEALLELAARNGARIERGVRVAGLARGEVETSAGALPASRILLATGKHEIRGARRTAPPARDGYVGFKMHWRTGAQSSAEAASAIELVLFDGGYAGLQPVAADTFNLCLIVRRKRLAEAGGSWEGLLALLLRQPHLAQRLEGAEPLFARPLTIANLPYGYVCAPASSPEGVFRLGDQAAMTPSLTGDGMAIALRSARLAAEHIAAGASASAYHSRLRRMISGQVGRAMILQRVTELPLAMSAGFGLLRLWPRLLGHLAGATRLPASPSP
jgi:flavin-dependent dehydrogenase